jgi:hypothetical protein
MTAEDIVGKLRSQLHAPLPLPANGQSALRHTKLWAAGYEDLSYARVAEAHWDAVAILAESGRQPMPGMLYGVWASELPDKPMCLQMDNGGYAINGTKMFCSGTGLLDYALVTVGIPDTLLVEVDLRESASTIQFDTSSWATSAFRQTYTGRVTFAAHPVLPNAVVGDARWYLDRPGFWHGACGPAACWAGGAEALVQYAKASRRHDAHTVAHFGAMHSSIFAMRACLEMAANEMDADPFQCGAAQTRALTVRHLVEQHCTDILRRFARAYGPFPLSMDDNISRRYHELDLYLRQSHAERDLEKLGSLLSRND